MGYTFGKSDFVVAQQGTDDIVGVGNSQLSFINLALKQDVRRKVVDEGERIERTT